MRSTVIRPDGSICVHEEPARPMLRQSALGRVPLPSDNGTAREARREADRAFAERQRGGYGA